MIIDFMMRYQENVISARKYLHMKTFAMHLHQMRSNVNFVQKNAKSINLGRILIINSRNSNLIQTSGVQM